MERHEPGPSDGLRHLLAEEAIVTAAQTDAATEVQF